MERSLIRVKESMDRFNMRWKNGKRAISARRTAELVGPPLIESFRGLGFDEAAAQQAVAFYRENYRQAGMFQVQPYPLIEETLQELAQDHDLYIATSKPEVLQRDPDPSQA